MHILDGIKTSKKVERELKKELGRLKSKIKLAVILVGNNPASIIYVNKKKEKCKELGIECKLIKLNENLAQDDLDLVIDKLNNDKSVTGILVQLPLPKNIDTREILDRVSIKKDVDGLKSYHLIKILLNEEKIIPCTPQGILLLLNEYNISLEGKNVCIIGFSDVVGKPLATLCLNRGATVTVCHKKTKKLNEHTLSADIIMTATGIPKLIKADMVKEGAIVIDIGISKVNGKTVGDVDFDNVKDKCSYITPVPGGVGPMTIISLIHNLILLKKLQSDL